MQISRRLQGKLGILIEVHHGDDRICALHLKRELGTRERGHIFPIFL